MAKNVLNKLTINLCDTDIRNKLYQHLIMLLKRQEGLSLRPLVVLCIGSDRYTGDALGPLIGTYLEEHTECSVYGTLDHPVHAGNFIETLNIINHRYHHPLIVAIDACLGKSHEIGNIEIWQGGLAAGIAVGNRLPTVGDISVIGVVNAQSQIGYLDLQSTPLSKVMKLTKAISESLVDAINTVVVEAMPACTQSAAK
ncbi:spore protease YyaC [Sporomusa malonica]|uniref:Putative sporulation protein YyaC n=1 Tax=Sporomusa malonica TaxID=112901 RepID=A0A1W2CAS0_9FIRM|nr:spore protease YyaC [Sporomusa malonica]SMC82249.1 putative sporulation protein YyaC [Sporomusa malonica]